MRKIIYIMLLLIIASGVQAGMTGGACKAYLKDALFDYFTNPSSTQDPDELGDLIQVYIETSPANYMDLSKTGTRSGKSMEVVLDEVVKAIPIEPKAKECTPGKICMDDHYIAFQKPNCLLTDKERCDHMCNLEKNECYPPPKEKETCVAGYKCNGTAYQWFNEGCEWQGKPVECPEGCEDGKCKSPKGCKDVPGQKCLLQDCELYTNCESVGACGTMNCCKGECTEKPCKGTEPSESGTYKGKETYLGAEKSWVYVGGTSFNPCEWACQPDYEKDGNSCKLKSNGCTGTKPEGVGMIRGEVTYPEGHSPTVWTFSNSDSGPCLWNCSGYYSKDGLKCTLEGLECTNDEPGGAGVIKGDVKYPAGHAQTSWKFSNVKSGPCYWNCSPGYEQNGNTACRTLPNSCSGTAPTGAGLNKGEAIYMEGHTPTTWTFSNIQVGECLWNCSTGYTRDGNTCKAVAAECFAANIYEEYDYNFCLSQNYEVTACGDGYPYRDPCENSKPFQYSHGAYAGGIWVECYIDSDGDATHCQGDCVNGQCKSNCNAGYRCINSDYMGYWNSDCSWGTHFEECERCDYDVCTPLKDRPYCNRYELDSERMDECTANAYAAIYCWTNDLTEGKSCTPDANNLCFTVTTKSSLGTYCANGCSGGVCV